MIRPTAYAFLWLSVLLFLPLKGSALEVSSKRDCAICHVMWIEDFRTDKETLIEWQPGNVLMKDTQGVVSSEEICYSCHDGYVMDSRHEVWKNHSHKTFVRPSKKTKIPDSLPLSVKGEIYCGTCHSPHGIDASKDDSLAGFNSFFRESNVNSRLCELCHKNEADYKQSNSHPVQITASRLPEKLFDLGSVKGKDRDLIICQTCHKIHGAVGQKILVIENNRSSKLCSMCHEQNTLIDTKHDIRLTLPNATNIKGQAVSESGPCGACHIPHNGAGKKLWARPLESGDIASQMCLTCHNENSGYKTKTTGKYSHPISIEPKSKKTTPRELPLFFSDLTKNPGGKVQCLTCHDIHRWDPTSVSNKGGKDIEGNASNSFLRISNDASSDLCLDCHSDKNQLIISDHNLTVTAPDAVNSQGFMARVSGPCGACHIPHNAEGKRLWAKELAQEKTFIGQLCEGCHSQDGIAKEKWVGENTHPVYVPFEKGYYSAQKRIEKALPYYDDDGSIVSGGKMVCLTCHDPHNWDPAGSDRKSEYSFKNMEGNSTNSFLRRSNLPASELCEICHENSALVVGTDHDLNVTAPTATNLLGQTVGESGPCGVCHVVHNSPHKLVLWARSLGPISDDENIMSGLCTSCHSKGEIAKNKIPAIATHPSGKLINNIRTFNPNNKDYTHIFDNTGAQVNVGDISCPSCHSFSRWSPLKNEKGQGENIEGDAMNSFLRTTSDNAVCVDCHGSEAIIRYSFFHLPGRRLDSESGNTPPLFQP